MERSLRDSSLPAALRKLLPLWFPAAARLTRLRSVPRWDNLLRPRNRRNVQPPAVIVVGETAALDLTFSSARPLEGVQVALVGTPILQQRLNDALSPLGARSFAALTSQLEELPCSFDLNILCDGTPRWVVLTSQNGVDCFFRRLEEQNIDLRKLHACRFAAIGKATEASLASHGIHADLCPPVHTTQALAQALVDTVPPG